MVTSSARIAASTSDDEDPGWCPQRKGDKLCAKDWGHYGNHDFSRKAESTGHARCSFSKTETVVLKLGTRQHTQQWVFTCLENEGHRAKHRFSPIPDGQSHEVNVPRSHWKRQRTERRRLGSG
jgi:hypothetical protein